MPNAPAYRAVLNFFLYIYFIGTLNEHTVGAHDRQCISFNINYIELSYIFCLLFFCIFRPGALLQRTDFGWGFGGAELINIVVLPVPVERTDFGWGFGCAELINIVALPSVPVEPF